MVFARTVPAERDLMQQFRQHTVHRRYLAIVQGTVEQRTIESYLVRDRGDGRRGSASQPGVGKRAVTHIRPLEPLDGYMLIECRLETGRTHQIRIHLAELGHPVCGEKIYHQPKFGAAGSDGKLRAPMDGKIVAINVAAGDSVTKGQTLIVLEAMKIQHQLKAALDARVESVAVKQGQQVSNRAILVTMAARDGAADAPAH
jgi:acetyl/propionyl-CoA carboxylase alpha subunit